MPQSIDHAYDYVKQLLSKLPARLCFHNWQHTQHVFDTCIEIGRAEGLADEDFLALQLAALFHDSGYLYQYDGHEERSVFLAGVYLKNQNYDPAIIGKVSGCINATRVPQTPRNLIEEILCDADLSHFASPSYNKLADKLRKEWELTSPPRIFTAENWTKENLNILTEHSYFTRYGKNILQPLKEANIKILEEQLIINP